MINSFFIKIQEHWKVLTTLILLLITFLSLWPLPTLPSVPGSDKTHHLIAYAVLAFPVSLARPKNWVYILICFILYSGMIELLQPYVNRYGEWLDMLANSTGIVLGTVLSTLLMTYNKKLVS